MPHPDDVAQAPPPWRRSPELSDPTYFEWAGVYFRVFLQAATKDIVEFLDGGVWTDSEVTLTQLFTVRARRIDPGELPLVT